MGKWKRQGINCSIPDDTYGELVQLDSLLRFFLTPFFLINFVCTVAGCFGVAFGGSYPLLDANKEWDIWSATVIFMILPVPFLTPLGISAIEPFVVFVSMRIGLAYCIAKRATRHLAVRILFPLVDHPNQLFSSAIYGGILLALSGWVVLLIMHGVYGDDKIDRFTLSIWSAAYCAICGVPGGTFSLIAGSTENAFAQYRVSIWRAYFTFSLPPEQQEQEQGGVQREET